MPPSHLILCCPLLLLPPIPQIIRVFSNESTPLMRWAKVLELQLQHQSFQWTPRTDFLYDGLVGSPCSPRDSQESSPIPQFKSINSLVLSFLHSPTLISIHDHWKNHSLDWMNLCWQSNISANMLLEISGEITPERMKGWSQSKNNTHLWMCLVIEAMSDAVKSNIA